MSRQGIVESLVPLPDANAIVDVAASPSGVAMLSMYATETHVFVLDVLLLDPQLTRVAARTTIGSIIKSTGRGNTYLDTPHIAPFGTLFYAAWREGRSARYDRVVGTRVMLDGSAPDLVPSLRERDSLSATLLSSEVPPLAWTLALHPYGLRLAVQPIRLFGYGITTTFVEPDGSARKTEYRFSTTLVPPVEYATVQFANGSIAVVYIENGVAVVTPMLGPAPPSRRRPSRH